MKSRLLFKLFIFNLLGIILTLILSYFTGMFSEHYLFDSSDSANSHMDLFIPSTIFYFTLLAICINSLILPFNSFITSVLLSLLCIAVADLDLFRMQYLDTYGTAVLTNRSFYSCFLGSVLSCCICFILELKKNKLYNATH